MFLLFVTEQACKPRTYARTTTFTSIAKIFLPFMIHLQNKLLKGKVMMTQKSCYIWEGSVVQFDFRAMIAYFPEDPFNGPFLLLFDICDVSNYYL